MYLLNKLHKSIDDYLYKPFIPILILIRHGECLSEVKDRLFGQMDVPLDPVGHQQLVACGTFLAQLLEPILSHEGKILSFKSSDLLRCIQSADLIQQVLMKKLNLDLEITFTHQLREFHIGDWENKLLHQVHHEVKEFILAYKKNKHLAKPPGRHAESEWMIKKRVYPLLKEFHKFKLPQFFFPFYHGSHPSYDFKEWLMQYQMFNIRCAIHLWVVHEGSAHTILEGLNIKSWETDVEAEYLHDVHQHFFDRGDVLILEPKLNSMSALNQGITDWKIAFHFKSSDYANLSKGKIQFF